MTKYFFISFFVKEDGENFFSGDSTSKIEHFQFFSVRKFREDLSKLMNIDNPKKLTIISFQEISEETYNDNIEFL